MEQILKCIHETLRRSNLSAEQISERAFGLNVNGKLRKSLSALYKELDPDITTAKLGVVDFIRIIEVTGDVQALEMIADRLGFMLRKKSNICPDQPHWQGEHAQDTRHLGRMSEMMESGANPSIVQTQASRMCTDIEETAIRYAQDFEAGKIPQARQ